MRLTKICAIYFKWSHWIWQEFVQWARTDFWILVVDWAVDHFVVNQGCVGCDGTRSGSWFVSGCVASSCGLKREAREFVSSSMLPKFSAWRYWAGDRWASCEGDSPDVTAMLGHRKDKNRCWDPDRFASAPHPVDANFCIIFVRVLIFSRTFFGCWWCMKLQSSVTPRYLG